MPRRQGAHCQIELQKLAETGKVTRKVVFFRQFATGRSHEAGVQATQSMSRGEPEEDGHLLQPVVLFDLCRSLAFQCQCLIKAKLCGGIDNLAVIT